jgi:hypothetical protein
MGNARGVDDEHGGTVHFVVRADDRTATKRSHRAVQSVGVHEHGNSVVQVLKCHNKWLQHN